MSLTTWKSYAEERLFALPSNTRNSHKRYVSTRIVKYSLALAAVLYFGFNIVAGRLFEIGNVADFIICGILLLAATYVAFDSGRWNGRGWIIIAVCMLCWGIGISIKSSTLIQGLPLTVPSSADIFLVARAFLAAFGLFILVREWAKGVPLTIFFNGLTVALAAATVGAAVAEPMARNIDNSWGVIVTLTYPILSVGVLAFSLGTYTTLGETRNGILFFGNLGIFIFTLSDLANFFLYARGIDFPLMVIILGWLGAFIIIALGSQARGPKWSLDWKDTPITTIFPILAAAIAILLLGFFDIGSITKVLAALTVFASLARTFEAHFAASSGLKDNNRLLKIVQQRSVTDALTGLVNRRGLYDILDEKIGNKNSNNNIALLLMDLDHFKEVNDTLGHEFGDKVLICVGDRLKEIETTNVIPSRLGGDEFAVLLSDVSSLEEAISIAELIHSNLVQPFSAGDTPLSIEASIGVAMLGEDKSHSVMLSNADAAMYSAKRSGTAVRGWDEETMFAGTVEKLQLTGELRQAITTGQLELHYQPKMSIHPVPTMVGVEALVRWNHPVHGMISPADFIPHAESTALIHHLTDFVLESAINQATQWHNIGIDLPIAVNLSGRSLVNSNIVDQIVSLLTKYQCPSNLLEIEVTESAIMENIEVSSNVLAEMRELGIKISLDDFGSGNTSLAYLEQFPWSTIKIDKSLVDGAITSKVRATVLSTVITLGDKLGFDVVVEGVEDSETLELLRNLDEEVFVQGYIFAPSMKAKVLIAWLMQNTSQGQKMLDEGKNSLTA